MTHDISQSQFDLTPLFQATKVYEDIRGRVTGVSIAQIFVRTLYNHSFVKCDMLCFSS